MGGWYVRDSGGEGEKGLYLRPKRRKTFWDHQTYPEDNGEPLSENTLHIQWIVIIFSGLKSLYRERENVFIAADLLWYPEEGEPETCKAPDVMVAFDRPKREGELVSSYLQWEEKGIPPQVVFEVVSPGNRRADLDEKRRFYQQYGVEEYYQFNPKRKTMEGWVRKGEKLEAIEKLGAWRSPRLHIGFEVKGDQLLRILKPDGEPFLDPVETERLWQEKMEDERAEKERAMARAETERAEKERERGEKERALARAETERAEKERAMAHAETERAEKERAMAHAETERAEKERAMAHAETERAEKERAMAHAETERAEKERERAEKERLLALLKERGIDPVSFQD